MITCTIIPQAALALSEVTVVLKIVCWQQVKWLLGMIMEIYFLEKRLSDMEKAQVTL